MGLSFLNKRAWKNYLGQQAYSFIPAPFLPDAPDAIGVYVEGCPHDNRTSDLVPADMLLSGAV